MEHRDGDQDLSPAQPWASGADLWMWRQTARHQAALADVDAYELDWFLQAVSDLDPLALKLETFRQRPQIPLRFSLADLEQRWQRRRAERVPVQYLVGLTPWRNFQLQVSPAVLIPRPETELIIDLAMAAVAQSKQHEQFSTGIWVDLGTGSGAIALGLAQAFPQAQVIAVDVSPAALEVAKTNAAVHGLAKQISFRQGSWFEPLEDCIGQLSAIVSNPPYIPSATLPTLAPEVINHEPHPALDGGPDGLDAIRTLATQAPHYLQPGGLWLIEIMAGQGAAVQDILTDQGNYQNIQTHPDLAGLDRFIQALRH
ncbi:MAG: peptide chain release factor N(5)-glutamine methyltransferase [Nodosilinea sp.]